MSTDREIKISITARNLTDQEFAKARQNLAGISGEATGLSGRLSSLVGGPLKALGPALVTAFSATAVLAAGKKVLDFADQMVNLSAKTGIGTTGLQKLDLAFQQSGVSLDQVTDASARLANNLVSGNKGAVGAIEKLGLSVDALKRMEPADQFLAVADAVGQIQSPTEKTYAAMQIFGKGGVELLSGLTGHLKETTDEFENMGLIIDDQTLQAADAFGDQLGVMGRQLLGVAAQIVGPLLPALSGLATLVGKVGGVVGQVTGFFVDWIQKGLVAAYSAIAKFLAWVAEAATKIPILGKHLGFASDAAGWLRQSAAEADQYLVKLFTSTTDVGTAAKVAAPHMLGLGENTERTAKATRDLKKAQEEAADRRYLNYLGELRMRAEAAALMQEGLIATLRGLPAVVESMPEPTGMFFDQDKLRMASIDGARAAQEGFLSVMRETGQQVPAALIPPSGSSAWQGAFKSLGETVRTQLGPTIMAALTGGGDVVKSVAGLFGGQLTHSIFGSPEMQKRITSTFGATLGGAFNSLLPGIGALAGPLISGLSKLFGSIFGGPSEQEKEGRDVAANFRNGLLQGLSPDQMAQVREAAQGVWKGNEIGAATVIAISDAYIAAGHSAEEALAVVDKLWRAEKEGGDAVKSVIDEITGVIGGDFTRALEGAERTGANSFQSIGDQIRTLEKDAIGSGNVGLIKKVFDLEMQLQKAAENGVTDFRFMTDQILLMKEEIATGITVPIDFTTSGGGGGGGGSSNGGSSRGSFLTIAEAREAGQSYVPPNPDDYSDSAAKAEAREATNRYNNERAAAEREGREIDPENFHGGGWIRAHRGLWTDEVPLIGQSGERMLSRAEVALMGGRSRVDTLARGAGGNNIIVVVMDEFGSISSGHAGAMRVAEKVVPLIPSILRRHGVRV